MHYRVPVIKPVDVDLDKVMYNFRELDKTQDEIMEDTRGVFINTISEDEVHELLDKLYEYFTTERDKSLKKLQYRATHTLKDYEKKYGSIKTEFRFYKLMCDLLDEYDEIKDLTLPDLRLIKFIKKHVG